MANKNYFWNVIWADEHGHERVQLGRVEREIALQYIENYFDEYEKVSVFRWELGKQSVFMERAN